MSDARRRRRYGDRVTAVENGGGVRIQAGPRQNKIASTCEIGSPDGPSRSEASSRPMSSAIEENRPMVGFGEGPRLAFKVSCEIAVGRPILLAQR